VSQFDPRQARSSPESPVVGELLDAEDKYETQLRANNERWARLLSFWTDSAFEIPGIGWRFGLDPLVGLLPIAGDLVTTLVSFYILTLATRLRVPRITIARMTLNVAIDYVIGSIPLVGNIFDFAWKANQRNVQLLERALATPVHERRTQTIWDWLFVAGVMALLVAVLVGSILLTVSLAAWIFKAITVTS
jgi:hypothetical protein